MNQNGVAIIPVILWLVISTSGLIIFSAGTELGYNLVTKNLNSTSEQAKTNISNESHAPVPVGSIIPVVKTPVQNAVEDNDPIITCRNTNCGPIKIRKSECSDTVGYVCCQLGDKWTWYASRAKCSEDQSNPNPTPNNATVADSDPIVICKSKTGNIKVPKSTCSSYTDCPDGYGGYVFESQETCKGRWKNYAEQLNQASRDFTIAFQENLKLESELLQWKLLNQELEQQRRLQEMENLVKSIPEPNFSVPPLPTIAPSTPKPTPNYTCPGGGCWTKGSDLFTSPSLFGM